jgi:hypothetical protein
MTLDWRGGSYLLPISNYPLGLDDTARLFLRYLTLSIGVQSELSALGMLSNWAMGKFVNMQVSGRHSISGVSITLAVGCVI